MTETSRRPRYEALPVLTQILGEHQGLRAALLDDNRQQALRVLAPHIRSLSPSEQQRYGKFIISGIAGTNTDSPRWDPEVQVASTFVLPLLDFSEMKPDAIKDLQKVYVEGILEQKEDQTPLAAQALLNVGRTLIPHFARTTQGSMVVDIEQAWITALEDKGENWDSVARQAYEMTTDLAMQFIDTISYIPNKRKPDPERIRRKKEVYKRRRMTRTEIASDIRKTVDGMADITLIQVDSDRTWLINNSLFDPDLEKANKSERVKSISEQTYFEQAVQIRVLMREHGVKELPSEMAEIIRLYLQGVPYKTLAGQFTNFDEKMRALREVGALPGKKKIDKVRRAAFWQKSPQEIADETGVDDDIVELILSIPYNVYVQKEEPGEN